MFVSGETCDVGGFPFNFRMKSLEQDALKAQVVITKAKEIQKRGTLERVSETPSPALSASPPPLDGEQGFREAGMSEAHRSIS